jgi:hypothetical protein
MVTKLNNFARNILKNHPLAPWLEKIQAKPVISYDLSGEIVEYY